MGKRSVRSWTKYLHVTGALLSFLAFIPGGLWYNPANAFSIIVGVMMLLELKPTAKVRLNKETVTVMIEGIKGGLLIKEMFTVAAAIGSIGFFLQGHINPGMMFGMMALGLLLSDIGTGIKKKEIENLKV